MSEPVRVLHVLNTGSYSGAENVVITIINNLKSYENIQCTYLSLNGDIKERLEKENIDYYPVEKLSIKNLKKAIKILNPDIIHAHDYTATLISSLCFTKAKIIAHIHNNSPWIKKEESIPMFFFFRVYDVKKFLQYLILLKKSMCLVNI